MNCTGIKLRFFSVKKLWLVVWVAKSFRKLPIVQTVIRSSGQASQTSQLPLAGPTLPLEEVEVDSSGLTGNQILDRGLFFEERKIGVKEGISNGDRDHISVISRGP